MVFIMRYSQEWYEKKAKELLEREVVRSILELLLQGYSYREISEKLGIPYGSVRGYAYILKRGGIVVPHSGIEAITIRLSNILKIVNDIMVDYKLHRKIDSRRLEELYTELKYAHNLAENLKKVLLRLR